MDGDNVINIISLALGCLLAGYGVYKIIKTITDKENLAEKNKDSLQSDQPQVGPESDGGVNQSYLDYILNLQFDGINVANVVLYSAITVVGVGLIYFAISRIVDVPITSISPPSSRVTSPTTTAISTTAPAPHLTIQTDLTLLKETLNYPGPATDLKFLLDYNPKNAEQVRLLMDYARSYYAGDQPSLISQLDPGSKEFSDLLSTVFSHQDPQHFRMSLEQVTKSLHSLENLFVDRFTDLQKFHSHKTLDNYDELFKLLKHDVETIGNALNLCHDISFSSFAQDISLESYTHAANGSPFLFEHYNEFGHGLIQFSSKLSLLTTKVKADLEPGLVSSEQLLHLAQYSITTPYHILATIPPGTPDGFKIFAATLDTLQLYGFIY
jgi:hypothetical protein